MRDYTFFYLIIGLKEKAWTVIKNNCTEFWRHNYFGQQLNEMKETREIFKMYKAGAERQVHLFLNQEQILGYVIELFFHTFEEMDIMNLRWIVILIMSLEHKQLSCGMHWIYIFDLLNTSAARKISNIPTYLRISETN